VLGEGESIACGTPAKTSESSPQRLQSACISTPSAASGDAIRAAAGLSRRDPKGISPHASGGA
jgi:hypothetical protein